MNSSRGRRNGTTVSTRCTDDLVELELVDVLEGLAESHHMDRCVDAAFVGTEEAAAEADTPGIDCIVGQEDETKENPTDVHDDEQNLLDKKSTSRKSTG